MADDEKWRRYRKMANMMAAMIDDAFSEDSFERAGGQCVCEHCGLQYFEHPQLKNRLVLTCDKRFWKL